MRIIIVLLAIALAGCLKGDGPARTDEQVLASQPEPSHVAMHFDCNGLAGAPSMEHVFLGTCASVDNRATFLLEETWRVSGIQAQVAVEVLGPDAISSSVDLWGSMDGVRWQVLASDSYVSNGEDFQINLSWAGDRFMAGMMLTVSDLQETRELVEALVQVQAIDVGEGAAPASGVCRGADFQQIGADMCANGRFHVFRVPPAPVGQHAALFVQAGQVGQVPCPGAPQTDVFPMFNAGAAWSVDGVDWHELSGEYVSTGVPGGDWHRFALGHNRTAWIVGIADDPMLECPYGEPRLAESTWWFE